MKTVELMSEMTKKEVINVFGGYINPDYPFPGYKDPLYDDIWKDDPFGLAWILGSQGGICY